MGRSRALPVEFMPPGATAVALTLPKGILYEDWSRVGHGLGRMGRAVQWWLGDWLLYGEHAFGEKYAQAASETGFDEQTLNACQWVASRFPDVRRRIPLSWSHHREVAALQPKEADRWLARAEKEGWSRAQLRKALHPGGEATDPAATAAEAAPGSNAAALERLLRDAAVQEIGAPGSAHPIRQLAEWLAAQGVLALAALTEADYASLSSVTPTVDGIEEIKVILEARARAK